MQPTAPRSEVLELMNEHMLASIPVVGVDGKVLGKVDGKVLGVIRHDHCSTRRNG